MEPNSWERIKQREQFGFGYVVGLMVCCVLLGGTREDMGFIILVHAVIIGGGWLCLKVYEFLARIFGW